MSITDLDMAFGTEAFLPPMDAIPQKFFQKNLYLDLANSLFFGSPQPNHNIVFKPGFDSKEGMEAAVKAIRAHLSSWGPKHEHKMAGVTYMMSFAFDLFEGDPKSV